MSTRPSPTQTRARAAALPLERTLTYRLHQLHKLTDMDSQLAYPQRTGLSMSDGRCLTTIGTFAPLSVKALADKANLNKGQASRAAQALVEQGLVRKADHPGDGRGVVLTLTPAGRTVFARAMAMVHQRNQDIFGCLSEQEQSSLSALFDRLIAHARQSVVPSSRQSVPPSSPQGVALSSRQGVAKPARAGVAKSPHPR